MWVKLRCGPDKHTALMIIDGCAVPLLQSRAASWMQKMRTDGCWPLRTIGFATGAALVVIAGLTFAAKLLNLNVIAAINQVSVYHAPDCETGGAFLTIWHLVAY